MATTEDLVAYLEKHDGASLTDVLGALLKDNSLDECIRAISTTAGTGFVSYDVRVTLSLTPLGRTLAAAVARADA